MNPCLSREKAYEPGQERAFFNGLPRSVKAGSRGTVTATVTGGRGGETTEGQKLLPSTGFLAVWAGRDGRW
jgi:hypothetical protein